MFSDNKEQKRTEKEFLQLYDKTADGIFRYCLFRLFDRELAKEFTQEVFLRGWKELNDANKTVKYPKALLYKIAGNMIIDYKRKKQEESLETMQENGFDAATHSFEESVHTKIEYQEIIENINKLPEEYKEVIILRYVHELNPKEIAEITGQTTNIISVNITRGKNKLKQILSENIWTSSHISSFVQK